MHGKQVKNNKLKRLEYTINLLALHHIHIWLQFEALRKLKKCKDKEKVGKRSQLQH